MKTNIFWIILILIASIVGAMYYPTIRARIEKNCNARGGSYLAGHCIMMPDVREYEWCLSETRKQEGRIAILPMKCEKWVEKIYLNQ